VVSRAILAELPGAFAIALAPLRRNWVTKNIFRVKAQRQDEIRKEEGGQQAPFNLTTGSTHRQDQSQCFIGH
jgi:hypothetical protein